MDINDLTNKLKGLSDKDFQEKFNEIIEIDLMQDQTNVEYHLNEIFKNVDKIVEDTVKEAGKKARVDMKNEAKKIVKHYYDEYPERKFEPSYSLYRSFESYDRTRNGVINVGVEFMSSRIDGMHESNSRWHKEGWPWQSIDWKNGGPEEGKQYGAVESSFIMNNFWEGIHPKTLGNKYTGFTYYPIKKGKSPEELFSEDVESYMEDTLKPFVIDTFTQKLIQNLIE